MRVFINLFLTMFFVDGCVSVIDELFILFSQGTFFSGVRILVAGAVIVMALPVYLSLGIDKRLPKRILLPLLLFLFWGAVGTWLFPLLAENSIYGLLLASGQVFLCFLPLSHFQVRGRFGLQLPESYFRSPSFSLKNTLIFAAVNLVIAPIGVALLVMSASNSFIVEKTAGFVRLTPAGLTMTERVYHLDNKTIRLVSMIHVGDKEFYADLFRPAAAGRTIVLAEGVTDDQNLLRTTPDYGKMAGFLGLASQKNMRFKGRLIEADELEEPGFEPGKAGIPDILRADVDISMFDPVTRHFLDQVGKLLKDGSSLVQSMLAINTWAEKNITQEMSATILNDILHRRNSMVTRQLDQVLSHYDMIIIPWGALHMAEIEASVLKRGFVLQDELSRVSIDFRKLAVRRLSGAE